ncbi:hypothetical protein [Fluviicola taffensis]|uniref:Lipoprotein n=1 Tax=Fluviicola taffensis (strain DSM 16823 / NCIMB 13979 / RW262) TaxID=755732 RepID=F2IGM3_FLUTR|nr:hypothetical protein [Fluviicola taffensis]AEA43640.1 hypothetical protein Fluta_1648 [Fluviicola taffensis DSM 16823]
MKLGVLFIGTLFIFLLSTCTKFGKNVYVDGYVRNAITGEPYANISLRLYRGQISWGDPVGTASKTLKEVTTDANGYYKAEHLSTPFNAVYIQLGKGVEGGYILVEGQTPTVIKKGKKRHVDFGIVPYGAISIHIKNVSCFNTNDKIRLYFDGADYNSNVFSTGLMTELEGCIDIQDSPTKISMGNQYFHWEVTKNGITTTYYETIFVEENQTATLNVFY